MRAQLEAQARALQDPHHGPLMSISATLKAVVDGQEESRRLHDEYMRTQHTYHT
ncbi:hypothetical protein BGZ94_001743, partial [Podila epigama]